MSEPLTHRCSEPECCNFMEPTDPRSCRCHKTREQMAIEQRDELLVALREMVRTQQDWEDAVGKIIGRPPQVFPRAIDQALAAIAKATGGQP